MLYAPVLIAFGSNIDPLPHLYRGLQHLGEEMPLLAISTVYRTKPLPDPEGGAEGADYLNGAVQVATALDPHALKTCLRRIEQALHRVRSNSRFAPRTLDLDIAVMGELVLQTETLHLPDPDLEHRPFLAIPLAELAPDFLHPVAQQTLRQIGKRFAQPLPVDQEATRLLQTLLCRATTANF